MADRAGAGRRAKVSGDDFEAWVQTQLEQAVHLGLLAHWDHNEPHGKILHGRWEMVAPGIADFTAVVNDGHASTLAIEAKSRAGGVLYLREVEPRQRKHLDAVVHAGGHALLLVQLGGKKFACRWAEVPWQVRRSAQSLRAEDLNVTAEVQAGASCFLVNHLFFSKPLAPVPWAVRRGYPSE